jgi:galactokinase
MSKNLLVAESGICLHNLYGKDEKIIEYQKKRYNKLSENFQKIFGRQPVKYFSTPGRIEISGNHTDHNNGIVIAAGINLDSIACVTESDSTVEIFSEGFDKPFLINLSELSPVEGEAGTTSALIRGIAAGLSEKGYKIGGFKACITSDVLIGSGLSSSASVEVLIGAIFNHLYNNGKIPAEELAKIGQFAENKFFKKPCGLMDQVACAVGGIVSIDFKDKDNPKINKIDFDFLKQEYSMLVVHTGGSHINLTDDYAAIPEEMNKVARVFGKETCREVDYNNFLNNIKKIRDKTGDRAVLRAYHFFKENERVKQQIEALNKNNFNEFLKLVNSSGNSSFKWLQNIYSSNVITYQSISLVLAFTEDFISKIGEGACRVHGGGFEGTILVFLPLQYVDEFKKYISGIFGDYLILDLSIRQCGAVSVLEI